MSDADFCQPLLCCLDLIHSDENIDVSALSRTAKTPYGTVATVSVVVQSVQAAKAAVKDVPVTALINFPKGGEDTPALEQQAYQALAAGADEVSLTMPYKAFIEGRPGFAETQMVRIKRVCETAVFKVVLATDQLATPHLIGHAAEVALGAGADFLTTTTAETSKEEAARSAEILLRVLTKQASKAGLHIVSKLNSVADAISLFALAQNIRGDRVPDCKYFRLSATGLQDALVQALDKAGDQA